MLKKLQRKIVFMNMLLVGIILLAVLAVFCYNEARLERHMIEEDLSRSIGALQQDPFRDFRTMFPMDDDMRFPGHVEADPDDDGFDEEDADDEYGSDRQNLWIISSPGGKTSDTGIPTGTIAIAVDSSGNSVETISNGYDPGEEVLTAAVNEALAGPQNDLREDESLELFYLTRTADGTTYMAFADAAGYHEGVRATIVKSTVLWAVIMFLFFLISMFMARVAVRPVRESWDRQQEFVADASHELKTPLTVILANNNILLSPDRTLPEDDRKWIESTQDEAVHMKTLVDQLLFLARSDSGDQKMLLSDLDLGDMVMDDVLQFEPVAFERGIRLEPDLTPDAHIEGDSTMIRQLIHILLDNACKYAAPDSTVTVTLRREGKGVTLAVRNTGDPIPPEDLPHIFERFYRADKARTHMENTGGYGLGLSIARSIAEDHKGTISCTSNAEEGTTFTVKFRERLR